MPPIITYIRFSSLVTWENDYREHALKNHTVKVGASINAQPAGHTHIYFIIKLLPAGEFCVLALAAPAGRQVLSGPTLITHYSVWRRGGPPATLINGLLAQFASGRAVAGPHQMACDRPTCGAVHTQRVHHPRARFTFFKRSVMWQKCRITWLGLEDRISFCQTNVNLKLETNRLFWKM